MSVDPLERARRLLAGGDVEGATAALERVALADPTNAAVRHDIGYLALRRGRWAEAAASFEQALAIDGRFALASVRLGVARQVSGRHEAAIDAYRTASRLAPERADARFRLGALLEALGRSGEAEQSYEAAARTRPETALSRLGAVRALLARDRLDEAETAARALLALHPGHLEATDTLGSILADRGDLAGAASCFEQVALASPAYAGSFYDLVRCRRLGPADEALVAAMREAANAPALHPEARIRLELALGQVADENGDRAEAMRRFCAADEVRRGGRADTAAAIEARVDRLIATFDADRIARAATDRVADPRPILVVGLPRSGTTLVEHILSSHPDVHGSGELPFWTVQGASWERGELAAAGALSRVASDYLDMLRARAPGHPLVTDKAPLNLFWAGLVHEALGGGATIVVCRRRPIDVALSVHRTFFNPLVEFPTGGRALVGAVRALDRLADHWRAVLPGAVFHEVRYEALVATPEPVIRDLVAACGLSWNESCLAPERNRRPVRTPSRWQVRAPITAPAPDRWRCYEPWLGPLAALA